MAPREFLVVIGDIADTELSEAMALLGSYGDSSLHDFAFIVARDLEGTWEDPPAVLWSSSTASPNSKPIALFSWLAANRPELSRIRLAAMSTKMLDQDAHLKLTRGVTKLERAVGQYAVQVECNRYCVAFPAVNDGPPTGQFMRPGVRANLVVIPRDSSSFEAVARPISRVERAEFVAHVATEAATLFSLWREMSDPPAIDGLPQIPPGDNETIVYFASSRIGVLNCPPLPIAKLMSGDGELPCPHQYHPLPDAELRAGMIASVLYPRHLVFESTAQANHTMSVSVRGFWRRYFKELIGILGALPRIVKRGVQAEIDEIAGTALQEALGGTESVVRIIGTDPGGEVSPVSRAYVDEVIEEVTALSTEPLLAAIGSETWIQLVDQFLGVSDGGKPSEEARRQIADESYLTVLQAALGPEVLDVRVAMEEIYRGKLSSVSPESNLVNAGDLRTDSADSSVSSQLGLPVALSVGTDPEATGTAKLLEPPKIEGVTSAETGGGNGRDQSSLMSETLTAEVLENEPTTPLAPEAPLTHTNGPFEIAKPLRVRVSVLAKIGGLLEENADAASTRVAQMIDLLREMPTRFQAKRSDGYSTAAKIAVALGFSVIYMVTGALTERRYFLSGEALGASGQDYVWVLMSTVLVLLALLGLTFKNSNNSQARAIAFGTFSLVLLATEYVFFAPLRRFILSLSIVRESAIIGIAILVLTVALIGTAYARNRLSSVPLRRRYSAVLITAAWVYVAIGVTAYLGSDRSPLRELSAGTSLRLMIVGYILGIALVLTSALVTAFVMMQERYRMNRAQAELTWAIEELKVSAEASRRLNLARGQWVGTAIPLARLIQYPLGESIAHSADTTIPDRPRLSVLKVNDDVLNLKKPGEQSLSARLRVLFIRTGWLSRQYQQLITRYRVDRALALGLRPDAVAGDRPERCPATPSFADIEVGKVRGARWDFLRSVVSGEYDDSLLSIAGEVPLEEAYVTIIDDPEAHSVGDSNLIAPTFFARLLPTKPVPLPGGLVKTLFAGNDERRYLAASVWWPDELVARPNVQMGLELHKSEVLTPDRLTSWIRLFGACVLTSRPFRLSDVTLRNLSDDTAESGAEVLDAGTIDSTANY